MAISGQLGMSVAVSIRAMPAVTCGRCSLVHCPPVVGTLIIRKASKERLEQKQTKKTKRGETGVDPGNQSVFNQRSAECGHAIARVFELIRAGNDDGRQCADGGCAHDRFLEMRILTAKLAKSAKER
jgi:hypothetical protein